MGLKDWAEKNKAGGSVQQAKKAERAEKREELKAEFAATKAGFSATKIELANANKELKEGLGATKAKWDEDRAELAAERQGIRAEHSKEKAERVQAKEAVQAERDVGALARVAAERDAHLAQLDRQAAKGVSFEGATLKLGQVRYKGQGGSVKGATARVESAADVRGRITATRVLAVGVFALAAKKQTGHVFLTVEADTFEFVVEVPVKKEADARAFAAKINTAARG